MKGARRWTSGLCAFMVLPLHREIRVGEPSPGKEPHGSKPLSNLPSVGAKRRSALYTDKVTLQHRAPRSEEFLLHLALHNVRMSVSCNFTREEAKDGIIFDDIKLFSENQSYSEMGGTFLY